LLPLLIFLVPLLACSAEDSDRHYARALGIERQLLRSNPDADYSDSRYLKVLRELDQVPSSAPEYGRAQKLAGRISDGRRFAARDRYEQIDHLPDRLQGTESPKPSTLAARMPPAGVTARPRTAAPGPASAGLSKLTDDQKARLDITMYSTSWCGYCKKARRWLNANDIPFVEKDVEKDAEGSREFQEITKGKGGVPVITVGREVIRGFSERRLELAIERATR